jgi:predicted regulator of Ras-like GTPase activity (Roadblock/LC7/MglB family)
MSERTAGDLNWLLDDLVKRLAGSRHAVVLSSDGLLMGRSAELPTEDAEHLSAMCSGFQSLARGTGHHFGGGAVRQTVVEMDEAILLLVSAGHGASLALLADADADLGMLAYELNLLVVQVGSALATRPRRDLAGTPGEPGM